MGFFSSLFSGLGNAGRGIMNLFGGGGGGGQVRQAAPPMQQLASGALFNSPYQHGAGALPKMSQAGGGQGGSFLNSMFQNPGAGVAGLGVMGLGQLMNKPAKMPDFNSSPAVQSLMNWQNSASHPMDPNVTQSIQNSLNIQNEQRLRNLRDVYKNLRPGTDYTTDSAYQRDLANLNRQMSMDAADAMANSQLQSNQQQLGNLSNMANLQVGGQMGQAALDAQRQQQQNELFGNIGSMLLQSGIGMPDFMSMFKRGQI